ncbi:MAG: helix-turn-helix transcriptional regulator [Lachnospiraceae bacterium]|nr:helix-turn-helix transcriptional regulator [Lachnospiraceae bacterium]
MKDRIKQVRKDAGLTQKEFAERLGLKQNTIATYEMGKIGVSDTVLLSICREFDINEEWLRTGEGEMQSPISQDDRYAINLGKLQRTDDATIIRWVNAIAETNPEVLKDIENFMKKILAIENE